MCHAQSWCHPRGAEGCSSPERTISWAEFLGVLSKKVLFPSSFLRTQRCSSSGSAAGTQQRQVWAIPLLIPNLLFTKNLASVFFVSGSTLCRMQQLRDWRLLQLPVPRSVSSEAEDGCSQHTPVLQVHLYPCVRVQLDTCLATKFTGRDSEHRHGYRQH